jgi:RNA polymerase sigma-70 factor (ECF subfamily)
MGSGAFSVSEVRDEKSGRASELSEMAGLPATVDGEVEVGDLVRRAQGGDRSAFGCLVKSYGGQAFAVAYAILRDREEAEDAVQEAFIKAFGYISHLEHPDRFAPWLRSIVRQECCGILRRCRRRLALLGGLAWGHLRPDERMPEGIPGSEAYRGELWDLCISALSDRAREIVILHYAEGYSCEQIAELMGIREGTVKSHLFKARRKIGAQLGRLGVRSLDDI